MLKIRYFSFTVINGSRIYISVLLVIGCVEAKAQSDKWDMGFNAGLGQTNWVENYSTSGPLTSPNSDRVYKGDGVGVFASATMQYKLGRWRIGPSVSINRFQIGEVVEERNGQTLPTTARPPAVGQATLMGLKLGYVWNLGKKYSLSWGAEGGILHLGEQNDFFEKKKFYSAGLQLGKGIGRWTPTLTFRYQKILFDYPDYIFAGGERIHQNVRVNIWQLGIGAIYRL